MSTTTTTTASDLDDLRPTWATGRPNVSGRDATWYGPTVRAGGVELRLMQMAELREDGWHLDRAPGIVLDGNVLTIAAATKIHDTFGTLINQAQGGSFFAL